MEQIYFLRYSYYDAERNVLASGYKTVTVTDLSSEADLLTALRTALSYSGAINIESCTNISAQTV
jgi:hypothetical protein